MDFTVRLLSVMHLLKLPWGEPLTSLGLSQSLYMFSEKKKKA